MDILRRYVFWSKKKHLKVVEMSDLKVENRTQQSLMGMTKWMMQIR